VRGYLFFLVVSFGLVSVALCQSKRQYIIENATDYDLVDFTLTATSGSYNISPTHSDNPINIFGKTSEGTVDPEFNHYLENRINFVILDLQGQRSDDLGTTISDKVFGSESQKDTWNVFISQEKTLCLNLNYGIGDANVDLSGIPIQKLKINTGSADVRVGYHPGMANKTQMDTLFVKVDLGSVTFKRMGLSRAKAVFADVGFGDLTLDYGQKPIVGSTVNASVGAGSLEVLVPAKNTPVKIVVHNSPLCHVKMSRSFKEIEDNVFVNSSYSENHSNLLIFNVDVALGKIQFKEVK